MVGVVVLVATLSPGVALGAASTGAQLVPGLSALNVGTNAVILSLSCASAGNCAAGGRYAGASGNQAFVVDEVNGVWGGVHVVAANHNVGGYAFVTSVSCASAGNCVAGGSYADLSSYNHGFVVDEVNGVWGSAIEVAGSLNLGNYANVTSVSCASAGNCVAAGSYTDAATNVQAFVATEVNGVWGGAIEVAGSQNVGGFASINSVSCPSAGICVAGGHYAGASGYQAFVVDEVNGVWGNAIEVAANHNAGGSASVHSVSCTGAGTCVAVGRYADAFTNEQAFVVDEVNGVWGSAVEVAGALNVGGSASATSVSCASAGNCAVGGTYQDVSGNNQAFVVTQANGVWASAQEVASSLNVDGNAFVTSVSCASAGNCAAVGYYQELVLGLASGSFIVNMIDGAWGAATPVPGVAALSTPGQTSEVWAVSCPMNGTCAVGGDVGSNYEGFRGQAWVLGSELTDFAGPLNVTAVRGASWLRATWSSTPNALGYQCTLLTGIGVPSSFVLRTATPSCTFLGLDHTTAYGVEVSAVTVSETSVASPAWPATHRVLCARGRREFARVGVYPVCPADFRTVSSN